MCNPPVLGPVHSTFDNGAPCRRRSPPGRALRWPVGLAGLLIALPSLAQEPTLSAADADPSVTPRDARPSFVPGEEGRERAGVERLDDGASPLLLSVGSAYLQQSDGRERWGAMLLLGIPLDRLARRGLPAPSGPLPFADPPPSRKPAPRPPSPGGPGLPPLAPPPGPPPAPPPSPPAAALDEPILIPIQVTPEIARTAVRAALRRARLADPDARVDALASRSRASALLPELRLRAAHILNEAQNLAPTQYDPTRLTATDGTRLMLEARATWRLDRLVFAPDEIALERIRQERAEAQVRVTSHVLEALFAWQRALAGREDPAASPEAHLEASLRVIETEAELDLLTDGWFTRWRERAAATGGD